MTPQELLSLIAAHNGIQRANRFSVSFSTDCGGTHITSTSDSGQIDVSTSVPAIYTNFGFRGVELTPDRLTGPGIGRNIPTNPTFESDSGLLIRFPIEQDWNTYLKLNTWLGKLTTMTSGDSETITTAQYYDDCAANGEVKINALKANGSIACTFKYKEAFPIVLLPIVFNSETNVGNATFDVIFNFRTYVIEGI